MSKSWVFILIVSLIWVSCSTDRVSSGAGLHVRLEAPVDSDFLYVSYHYRDTLHIDTLFCDGDVSLDLSLPTDSFGLVTLFNSQGDSKRIWVYHDKRVEIVGRGLYEMALWEAKGDQWNSWRGDFDHQCAAGGDTIARINEFVHDHSDQPAATLLLSDYAHYGSTNNRLIHWVEQLKGGARNNPLFRSLAAYAYSGRQIRVGAAIGDFPAETKDRYWISNATSRGNHVLFYITASWSDSSRVVNRRLARLYRRCKDKGVEMFGWSLDADYAEFQTMLQADSIGFKLEQEPKGIIAPIVSFCAVSHLPSIYIVSPSGVLTHQDISVQQAENIIADIIDKE